MTVKSLADTLKETMLARAGDRPDHHTIAWWKEETAELRQLFKGCSELLHLAVANTRDNAKELTALQERIDLLAAENEMLLARMGEVQSENTLMQKRIDEMANWAARIQKDVRRTGDPSTTE